MLSGGFSLSATSVIKIYGALKSGRVLIIIDMY